jgi:hypothetical protein
MNFSRQIKAWGVGGNFAYAQNVQTLLVTYTSSYYNYSMNLHRRLPGHMQWTGGFNGSHSGLTNYQGTTSHSEAFFTSFGGPRYALNANYTQSSGISLLGSGNLQGLPPSPGITDFITFTGSSYGGGVSVTPIRRMVLAGSFSRAISDTLSQTISHNDTDVYNAQLQYHLRRIGLQAGYTRFTQGISAAGLPASTTSYFVGFTRWFDFF